MRSVPRSNLRRPLGYSVTYHFSAIRSLFFSCMSGFTRYLASASWRRSAWLGAGICSLCLCLGRFGRAMVSRGC
ncbi:hypothetical protein B0H14DRAFT_2799660 [Mycena olivaceomarginata]|nr:hypothetical protein B0H14DRAFT_2799660 [Mycena olivaceomarginata]